MIIDTHVHCFPDKISLRAITELSERSGLKPYTDGSLEGTRKLTKSCGVEKFVVLNISSNPKQESNVNSWAISLLADPNAIPFGSVHPKSDNKIQEIDRLYNAGIKGIKLHPDYQEFYVDDPIMDDVYKKCGQLGLIVVFHAGMDIGLPEPVHATPERMKKIVNRHPNTIFVAAHMGGFRKWDGVLEHLCGINNLYFDTGFCYSDLSPEIACKIIKSHGAYKILFASDLPWESPALTLGFIHNLNIDNKEKEMIVYKNAARLLKI